jgi:hypothetical protein
VDNQAYPEEPALEMKPCAPSETAWPVHYQEPKVVNTNLNLNNLLQNQNCENIDFILPEPMEEATRGQPGSHKLSQQRNPITFVSWMSKGNFQYLTIDSHDRQQFRQNP